MLVATRQIKTARIRNRYNQVPHLSQDTKWEGNKITMNLTNKGQEVSPFPSGDHKAAMNRRRETMANSRHKYHKCPAKEKYGLRMVSHCLCFFMGNVAMPIIIVYMYIDIYRGPQGGIAYVLIVTPSQNNV